MAEPKGRLIKGDELEVLEGGLGLGWVVENLEQNDVAVSDA